MSVSLTWACITHMNLSLTWACITHMSLSLTWACITHMSVSFTWACIMVLIWVSLAWVCITHLSLHYSYESVSFTWACITQMVKKFVLPIIPNDKFWPPTPSLTWTCTKKTFIWAKFKLYITMFLHDKYNCISILSSYW